MMDSQTKELNSESEQVDPELMQIPRPRRGRHPAISVVVIAMSLYLMVSVRADLFYFFEPSKPQALGEVGDALRSGHKLRVNSYVTVQGVPDRKHGLLLQGRFSGYESFVPLLQTDNRVYVQRHRKKRTTERMVSGVHTGRVVPLSKLPYRKAVRDYLEKTITIAHEIDFKTVVQAKQRNKRNIRDTEGRTISVEGRDFWINVSYPDEWIVQLSKSAYDSADAAQKRLKDLPFAHVLDPEPSPAFWRFVVIARGEQLAALMSAFTDPTAHAGVVRRQLSYTAKWSEIAVDKDALIISSADAAQSARYRLVESDGAARLEAEKMDSARIPRESIRYISTGSPFQMPDDAMVIVAGKRPGDYWHYLLLCCVLGLFVLVNSVVLIRRLFCVRASKSDRHG